MTISKLNKDTLIPLGIVAALIISTATGAVWINTKLQSIDHRMEKMGADMSSLQEKFDLADEDHWTFREMKLWSQLLKAKNPNIDIPNIDR